MEHISETFSKQVKALSTENKLKLYDFLIALVAEEQDKNESTKEEKEARE